MAAMRIRQLTDRYRKGSAVPDKAEADTHRIWAITDRRYSMKIIPWRPRRPRLVPKYRYPRPMEWESIRWQSATDVGTLHCRLQGGA
jgi:hypothetical protein